MAAVLKVDHGEPGLRGDNNVGAVAVQETRLIALMRVPISHIVA